MNQKKAKALRKKTKYKVQDDPIKNRKYSVLVCYKRIFGGGRKKTGTMLATKDERLFYRMAKKQYKAGLLPKARI